MFELKNYVIEISKAGSFSQAAKNLFISQPSLSSSIKRLEEQLGDELFDRSVHPIQLTECGEEYIRSARSIDEIEKNFNVYLEESRQIQTGKLTIGGSHLNLSYVLPPLLKNFQANHPSIDISLMDGNIDLMLTLLSNGEIDLLVDSCSLDKAYYEEYNYQPEMLLLAVPENHPCNERMKEYRLSYEDILNNAHKDPGKHEAPPLSLLGDAPFIYMTPDTDTGKREKKIFRSEGFYPHCIFTFRQQLTTFHMACQGIGCAIISDMIVKSDIFRPRLFFYMLNGEDNVRYIRFYKKKARRMTYAMRAFLTDAGVFSDDNQ